TLFPSTSTPSIHPLSLHDALPIFSELLVEQRDLVHADAVLTGTRPVHCQRAAHDPLVEPLGLFHLGPIARVGDDDAVEVAVPHRSEEHTSELQSRSDLVCRLLLEK